MTNASVNPNAADVNGYSPLMLAVNNELSAMTDLLLSFGADANLRTLDSGESAMHVAAWKAPAVLALLLGHGGDANLRSLDGATPLHFAARADKRDNARALLLHGARVNDKDNLGRSALWHAVDKAHVQMCALLLERAADPNVAEVRGGWMPLAMSADKLNTDLAQELLRRGADPCLALKDGRRPEDIAKERAIGEKRDPNWIKTHGRVWSCEPKQDSERR